MSASGDSTSDNHAHADVSAQSLSIHGSDNSVVLDVDSALEVAVALGEGSQSLAEKPEDAAEFEDTIESTSAAEHEDAFEGSAAEDSDAVGGEANAQIVSLDRYLRVFDSALHRKPGSYSRAITVLIGPKAVQFCVHEDVLKAQSEYFKVALEGEWEEAKSGKFELDEESACIFELFLDWVYYGKISYDNTYLDTDMLLVELYLFGERRGCTEFQNEVVDEIAAFMGNGDCELSSEAIMLLFNETTTTCKLRRCVADKIAWEDDVEKQLKRYRETPESIHHEFAFSMYEAMLERMATTPASLSYTSCGGQEHNFRCPQSGCGKSPDMALHAFGSRRLAGREQAPYFKGPDFCSRYHIHSKGETCK